VVSASFHVRRVALPIHGIELAHHNMPHALHAQLEKLT